MRLLDLYCCEGLGAWGYWLSGRFSKITLNGMEQGIAPAMTRKIAELVIPNKFMIG